MCIVLVLITECDKRHEKQINVKFLVKLKKTLPQCNKLLKETYGKNTLSLLQVFKCNKQFLKAERASKMTNIQVNCLCPQTVIKINKSVGGDHRMSIWMIAETVNTNKETIRKILHNKSNMKKVCEKLVPKNSPLTNQLTGWSIGVQIVWLVAQTVSLMVKTFGWQPTLPLPAKFIHQKKQIPTTKLLH